MQHEIASVHCLPALTNSARVNAKLPCQRCVRGKNVTRLLANGLDPRVSFGGPVSSSIACELIKTTSQFFKRRARFKEGPLNRDDILPRCPILDGPHGITDGSVQLEDGVVHPGGKSERHARWSRDSAIFWETG